MKPAPEADLIQNSATSQIRSEDREQKLSDKQNNLPGKHAIIFTILGVAIILTLVASLSFAGYNNYQLQQVKMEVESMKELECRNSTLEQINNLTELLLLIQVKIERQNEALSHLLNSTSARVDAIDTLLNSTFNSTVARCTSTHVLLSSLVADVSHLNSTLQSTADYIASNISSYESEISSITDHLTNLNLTISSQAGFFRDCQKRSTRCQMLPHVFFLFH